MQINKKLLISKINQIIIKSEKNNLIRDRRKILGRIK